MGLLPACLYECLDPASPGGTVAPNPRRRPRALPHWFSPFPAFRPPLFARWPKRS